MTNQQKFIVGTALGAAAMLAGGQLARRRRAIDFAERVVVITGGSRGLGLVLARQFAAEGARLVLIARDEAELERARQQLAAPETDAMVLRCDVRRRADVRAAVDRILERWGGVDVLVNNAGIIQVGPLEHMVHEDFENAMATHFWGPLHMMLETVPSMKHRGFGRIVNITSIGGRLAVPHLAPYCASKFALVGLSDAVRTELNRYGILVTTVVPGLMRTGSPRNITVKGNCEAEYGLFKLSSSIPGLTISAERAARQIIQACRFGDAELTITPQARLAAIANAVTPAGVGHVLTLVHRLLPGPVGPEGDQPRRGHDCESSWAPGALTTLTDQAAVANNEI